MVHGLLQSQRRRAATAHVGQHREAGQADDPDRRSGALIGGARRVNPPPCRPVPDAGPYGPGFKEGDKFEASLNGVPLRLTLRDLEWKDPQIFSPKPQRTSGGTGIFEIDPDQELLRLEFEIDPRLCRQGENHAEIRIAERAPYRPRAAIVLEKLEVHLRYSA